MELATYHKEVKPLITERMQEIFADVHGLDLTGKHLRGLLCILLSDALGGDRDKALTSAAVVDAIHAASLIHDDIVDVDETRRGQPSLWVTNGIKKAIFAGDRVFAIAHKRAAMLGAHESAEVAEALDTTVGAWVKEGASKPAEFLVDLFTGKIPDVGYQKLCLTKTAPFFKAAARLGGIAANSDEKTLDALSNYAEKTGLAFQIADDIKDLQELQKETGIPDWKKFIPVLPAIIHYNGRQLRQALFEVPLGIFRDSLIGKPPGEKLISLLFQSNIIEQMQKDIEKEIQNAVNAIEGIKFKKGYKGLVRDYPGYAVNLMLHEADKELKPVVKVEKGEK